MSSDKREPEVLDALRLEVDAAERQALRRVDPGGTAVVIAAAMMLLLVATVLPWIGPASGFEVLRGTGVDSGLLTRLFAAVALGFGAVGSALALLTRRWALVWVCALGCGYSVLDGVWAIWARQTADGPGPGIGLVLAELAMVVLAAAWVRLAASRR